MKTRRLRDSLKMKTSLIAVSVIILSMTVCGWLLTSVVERQLKSETIHSAQLNAELLMQRLDDQFSYMRQAYFGLVFDTQLQDILQNPEGDQFLQGVREKLDTALTASNFNVYSVYIKNFQNNQIFTTDFLLWQDAGDYGGVPQYGVYAVPELIVQEDFASATSTKVISLAGQILSGSFGEPLGWVSVNVRLSTFTAILRDDQYYADAPLLLADDSGQLVTTGKTEVPEELLAPALAAQTGATISLGNENYIVIAAETGSYEWQYRKLLPESRIFAEVYRLQTVLFAILLAFSAVVFLGLYQVLNYITNPIYDLSNRVRSYRQRRPDGPWGGDFHTDRKDEFAYLYQSLQEMTDRIDHLIDQEYKAQLYKKETQLRIYRNGVNPHFLYNILDSLLWTIKFGDTAKAEAILRDFSVFLHHVLHQNKEFVSVRDTQEELRTYCTLSSFLKDDEISWEVLFSEDALGWMIPSFCIQPLAENCFKHAFNGGEGGRVTITGDVENGELVFRVADDGAGMTPERCEELLRYLDNYDFDKESAHFGLASVHQRLKLYYGSEYGLQIETAPGRGTAITVRMPTRKLHPAQEIE